MLIGDLDTHGTVLGVMDKNLTVEELKTNQDDKLVLRTLDVLLDWKGNTDLEYLLIKYTNALRDVGVRR